MRGIFRHEQFRRSCAAFMIAAPFVLAPQLALAQAEQRSLVTAAVLTLSDFLADPDMNWIRLNLPRAKAVFIAPGIIKAALVVGGSGGRAVAAAQDPKTGRWIGPAFYTLVTASVGIQAGIASSDVVTLVMTDVGLQRLLSNSFHMGGDISIAMGPIGRGARAELVADFVSFSRSEGAYIGLDLTGTAVTAADDWNQLYYGQAVKAADILVRQAVHNRQANELRINRTYALPSPEARSRTTLRAIDVLVIAPSQRLDDIAARHINSLPRAVRLRLSAVGVRGRNGHEPSGAALASYLLFEAPYTGELIALGEFDTLARRAEVLRFFGWGRRSAVTSDAPSRSRHVEAGRHRSDGGKALHEFGAIDV